MNKTVMALAVFALTIGSIASWVLLSRPAQVVRKAACTVLAPEPPKQSWRDRVRTANDAKTPEERAEAEYLELLDPKERLDLIRWVGEQDWAGYKTPVLRKALVADADGDVQLEALAQSLKLAREAGPASIAEVIRNGLSAGNVKVTQQSLREARKHPCVELVPDLLQVADSSSPHRFLAIDALAFTDDDRARAKVIEVASREDGEKSERIRAIALLSKVKGEQALELLGRLAGSLDQEVRNVALEALAARDAK